MKCFTQEHNTLIPAKAQTRESGTTYYPLGHLPPTIIICCANFLTIILYITPQGAHGDFGERGETGQAGADVSMLY